MPQNIGFLLKKSFSDCFYSNIRYKGHDMLAPFTARWKPDELHPLVIDKSEVKIINIYKYWNFVYSMSIVKKV